MNNIVRFNRPTAPAIAPDVHPAALSAAQLCVLNDIAPADFMAAHKFFSDLYSSDD